MNIKNYYTSKRHRDWRKKVLRAAKYKCVECARYGIGLGVVIKKLNPIDEGPILTDEQAECEYRTDIDLITGNEKKEEK